MVPRRQSGFTLIELMIVVVIMGAITLVAFPRLKDTFEASGLRGARARLITVHGAARAAAVQTNRAVRIHFSGNTMWITASRARTSTSASSPSTSRGRSTTRTTADGRRGPHWP